MRLGLIADTHDRVPAVAAILRRFAESGVDMILHAGDYCSPFVLQPFQTSLMPTVGVYGRNDGDREELRTAAGKAVAFEMYESPHSMELGGRRVLLTHDVGEVAMHSLSEHGVVVYGASHRAETATSGSTLLVNPGEACGWIYGVPSAAILDLDTLHVDFFTLEGGE